MLSSLVTVIKSINALNHVSYIFLNESRLDIMWLQWAVPYVTSFFIVRSFFSFALTTCRAGNETWYHIACICPWNLSWKTTSGGINSTSAFRPQLELKNQHSGCSGELQWWVLSPEVAHRVSLVSGDVSRLRLRTGATAGCMLRGGCRLRPAPHHTPLTHHLNKSIGYDCSTLRGCDFWAQTEINPSSLFVITNADYQNLRL